MQMISCPWENLGCTNQCHRKEMHAHIEDNSAHFPMLLNKVTEIQERLNSSEDILNSKIDEIHSKKTDDLIDCLVNIMNEVFFYWEIPNFDIKAKMYESTKFSAFGHTLYLTLQKNDSKYALYLTMKTQFPDTLEFKFTVGRYTPVDSDVHSKTEDSGGYVRYPDKNTWSWGIQDILKIDNLTCSKYLTTEGTLQIKCEVRKQISSIDDKFFKT